MAKDIDHQYAGDLSNHFLMAMPGMSDPNFESAVVILAEHNHDGALGLVVNRPSEMTLERLFEGVDLQLSGAMADQLVLYGGPVHSDRGFVLHSSRAQWDSSISISESMALTSSRDILEALADGGGPDRFLVTLGCSSWGPGQLEKEMAANVWLTVQAEAQIIFDTPVQERFALAYQLLGVDPALMSGAAGHA